MEGSSFILVDIFDNLWVAPEVFLKWQKAVDRGSVNDVDLGVYHLCISHIGSEFCIYYSLWREAYKAVHHPAPPPFSPLPASFSKEDEAFPPDEDPNFSPTK